MKESQYLREKYEAEALAGRDDSQELIEKTISVKISLKHYSMLKALGDRFSDPISGLGGQFLEEEIEEKTEVVFAHILMSARNREQLQEDFR